VDWGKFRLKKHAQTDEESVLMNLSDHFCPDRFIVDIGAGDGASLSNSLHFVESGWSACRIDGAYDGGDDVTLHRAHVTKDNVCDILSSYMVPHRPGILSIDIDGIDLYVLHAVLGSYRPTIIVFEFNGCLVQESFGVIEYSPTHSWDGSDYYGASWAAFDHVLGLRGYTTVHHSGSMNGYAVDAAHIPERVSHVPCQNKYHRHDGSRQWLDARDVFTHD
jgi:hypothetical protein